MIKNCLLAVALLTLALASGCATGGNGIVPVSPSIDVEITNPTDIAATQIYPGQSVTLTATVSNAPTTAVTWSLTGPGTLTPTTPAPTPATAVYVAPATAGSQGAVTARLTAETSIVGSLPFTIADITTQVAPTTLSVGTGLTQQFTATASPDDAPQSFTWNCTAGGVQCKNFVQDPNVSGLAYYTAQDSCTGNCVQISAAAPLDPAGCTPNPKFCTVAKTSLVSSRINGTYAFRFSGYDGSNNAVAVAGTFTASNGTIASGVEDELILSASATHSISGGSYTPTSSDPNNSNNAGTLSLALPSGVYPRDFQVVLDGAGDIEMIESDGHGSGSGIAQVSVGASPFKDTQTYAFGFTGVDAVGKRVGYAGLFPMDGSGNIVAGEMDVNDNGSSSDSVCSASPCTVTGSYSGSGSGPYQLTLTAPVAMTFDFYIASGSNSNKSTPLTFYAISTAPGANPAVSGTMVLQDSSQTYNNSAFNGVSVSALTGTATCPAQPCSNVSLTLGATDGNGNFSGQFDQNNAGAVLSLAVFPASSQSPSPYTYTAKGPNGTTNGRYIFNMLGDPTAKTPVAPLPFVLYASGANRGFLLDQSSASVMTGTMNPQGKGSGSFAGVSLQGTYAAATTSSGSADVNPIGANLLLTSPGGGVFNIGGTQYQYPTPGQETVTGTLSYNNSALGSGVAIVTLTAPSAQTQALYPVDTSACVSSPQNPNPVCQILDFFMIDETSTNKNASVIFAKQ